MTDIVGSTEMFRRIGHERYVERLDAHRGALRTSWARHGGWEVTVAGDEFLVAFTDAAAALDACLSGQAELARRCPDVRVRMAIHCGWAVPRSDGEYVALPIHETARVITAAVGATIVLSEAVHRVLPDRLHKRTEPMGLVALRDFRCPVELFTISHAEPSLPVRRQKRAPNAALVAA